MIKNKGPLFLDENGVVEQQELIQETENKAQEEITVVDVNNEIITAIQKILEVENIGENIDTLINYLELFGFDIDKHVILDEKIVNDSKITYKYKLSEEGKVSIKGLLTYQGAKKIITQKLASGINFASLNKKLGYLNSNKGQNIKVSDNYTEKELNELLKISNNISTDNKLSSQINELIKKLKNQDEYKARLEIINQAIISVNFNTITQGELENLSGQEIQNSEDTYSIYRSIISDAEQLVRSNYTEISYSYSEENTEYIESKKNEKEKKIAQQEEIVKQSLEDKINLEKEKKNKKIARRTVIAGMFGILIGGGIVLDNEYGEEESIEIKQLNGKNIDEYANNLYDELILKNNNISEVFNVENITDEELFESYRNEFNNFIISFMNTIGTLEPDINILKGSLGNGISLTGYSNHLKGKDILMNIKVEGNDTLVVNIQIGNKIIIDNITYSRKPLHKPASIDQAYQDKMNNAAIAKMEDFMKKSNNKDDLIKYISNNFGSIIREVFKDINQHFNVHIEYFGNKVYIKITNTHTNKEYNLSYKLLAHLI